MKKILAITALLLVTLTACSAEGSANPEKDSRARACVQAGHKVKEFEQFGGKYSRSTFWCEGPNKEIYDLWFEKDSKSYKDV